MPEPYDASKIIKLANELENEPGFKRRNEEIIDTRQVRYREKPVKHPRIDRSLEVRSSLLDEHISQYVARYSQARLKLDVRPKSLEQAEEARRAKIYWMRSYVVMIWSGDEPVCLVVLDRASEGGIGWYRLGLDPRIADMINVDAQGNVTGLDVEKGVNFVPFALQTPDPIAVYYDPTREHVAEIGYQAERSYRTAPEVTAQAEAASSWKSTVKIIHLETKGYVYDLHYLPNKDNETAKWEPPMQNPYGRPAYFAVYGRVTGNPNPALRYRSPVATMKPLVEDKNRYETMLSNAADLTGAPLFMLKKDSDPGDPRNWMIRPQQTRRKAKIDTKKGAVDVPEGYIVVPLSLSAGIDLVRAIENLRIDLNEVGFPRVLAIPHDVSAASGYDRGVMERATSMYIEPTLGHHSHALLEIMKAQAEALRAWKLPVTVRTVRQEGERSLFYPMPPDGDPEEVTTGPEDFVDVDLEARLQASTAESRIAKQEEGIRLLDHDPALLSVPEFIEDYRDVEDTERALELILRDRRRMVQLEAAEAYYRGLLARRYGKVLAETTRGRRRRQIRRRPPAGETAPGVGEDLGQPATPRTPPNGQVPGLGEVEG